MEELPLLNRIRKATAGTDQKMIAIDEDSEQGVAATLLKRREYDWQDFHFNPSVKKGLPTTGIPLLVVIDANGKIVYYHPGGGDESAMIAAIAKLGRTMRRSVRYGRLVIVSTRGRVRGGGPRLWG